MPQSLWRTDGPGDADHGDKRTSHLPQTKTVTEWRWLLSGVLFPTNNLTTDTCNRCQTLFQTDTRWHRQCLCDNDKATDKKHKESSVIWVVQHRPDTTRTAVVGRVIPCASSRINHTLVVCITWGPRTKCYHCDSKGTYHSPDNHWDKRQGKGRWQTGKVGARLTSLTQDLGGGDIWQPREPDLTGGEQPFWQTRWHRIWRTRTWGQWRRT